MNNIEEHIRNQVRAIWVNALGENDYGGSYELVNFPLGIIETILSGHKMEYDIKLKYKE